MRRLYMRGLLSRVVPSTSRAAFAMTNSSLFTIVALFAAVPGAAVAQDQVQLPTDQAVVGSQVLLTQRLADQNMAYPQRHNAGPRASRTANARATCANKRRAAANFGTNHPKVRQLYALCALAGY